jgi:hypothetical protein
MEDKDMDTAYERACFHRDSILPTCSQLAGEEVEIANESWQQAAKRLAGELRRYATFLEGCATGEVPGPIVFPSWKED